MVDEEKYCETGFEENLICAGGGKEIIKNIFKSDAQKKTSCLTLKLLK